MNIIEISMYGLGVLAICLVMYYIIESIIKDKNKEIK